MIGKFSGDPGFKESLKLRGEARNLLYKGYYLGCGGEKHYRHFFFRKLG